MKAPDFSTRPRPAVGAWELPLLAAGLATLLATSYAASSAWAGLRAVLRASEATRRELAELGPRLLALAERVERGDRAGAARAALTLEAPPRLVLAELTRLLPAEVRLVELSLDYGRRVELDARVEARTPEAYDRFLERLSASPAFEQVVPGAETREGPVRVSLRMAYREEARR